MKLLVTGATGFIGSHFVRKSLENGWSTHALVRESSRLEDFKGYGENMPHWHRYTGQLTSLIDTVNLVRPDVVVHIASCFIAEHKPHEVDQLVESNLLFGTHLLEAMTLANVKHFLNVGTSWQHFEDRDYSPVCLYAATKEAFEKLLQYYEEVRGINTLTLKLFDTYGPGDERKKLFFLLKNLAKKDASPLDMSGGEQLLNLVHIEDVTRAFESAVQLLLNGDLGGSRHFTVHAEELISLRDLVALVEAQIQRKLPINWGKRPYRTREVMRPYSKVRPVTGWKPQVTLKAGIAEIFGKGGADA